MDNIIIQNILPAQHEELLNILIQLPMFFHIVQGDNFIQFIHYEVPHFAVISNCS